LSTQRLWKLVWSLKSHADATCTPNSVKSMQGERFGTPSQSSACTDLVPVTPETACSLLANRRDCLSGGDDAPLGLASADRFPAFVCSSVAARTLVAARSAARTLRVVRRSPLAVGDGVVLGSAAVDRMLASVSLFLATRALAAASSAASRPRVGRRPLLAAPAVETRAESCRPRAGAADWPEAAAGPVPPLPALRGSALLVALAAAASLPVLAAAPAATPALLDGRPCPPLPLVTPLPRPSAPLLFPTVLSRATFFAGLGGRGRRGGKGGLLADDAAGVIRLDPTTGTAAEGPGRPSTAPIDDGWELAEEATPVFSADGGTTSGRPDR